MSIGMFLGVLLTWQPLEYKNIYRTLLLLPYAVPAFISILIFKGLFNANFGEFNLILDALFGIRPEWFSNAFLAKVMILIVNTWLGYPYMMLLTIGYVQSIPVTLYEASAIDGSTPVNNFFRITLPLIIRPMMPLLISCFSFNFNNFVLIFLLTKGRPDFLNAATPAGTTDILVSYTYRLAFQDSGQQFGFAASIATVVFIIVAILSIINIKLTLSDKSVVQR
jgi:maltose/maltodextrin transport system permease protein